MNKVTNTPGLSPKMRAHAIISPPVEEQIFPERRVSECTFGSRFVESEGELYFAISAHDPANEMWRGTFDRRCNALNRVVPRGCAADACRQSRSRRRVVRLCVWRGLSVLWGEVRLSVGRQDMH